MANRQLDIVAFAEQHGLKLVAEPTLNGPPWGELKQPPEFFLRNELTFYLYDPQGKGHLEKVRAQLNGHTTEGGSVSEGADVNGRPLARIKLKDAVIPEDMDITPYVQVPGSKSNASLLYPMMRVPPQRYHVDLPGNRHMLLFFSPKKRDESTLRNQLEDAGLFRRGNNVGDQYEKYTVSNGIVIGIVVPAPLMRLIERTEGNKITPFTDACSELEERQKEALQGGTLSAESVMQLAVEQLKAADRSVEQPNERKKKRAASASGSGKTLSEIITDLPQEHFTFSKVRDISGRLVPVLHLTHYAKGQMDKAQDPIRLTTLVGSHGEHQIPEGDASRLKALIGEGHYTETDRILPARVPNNFFKKYNVRFARDEKHDVHYMYASGGENFTAQTLTGDGFPASGENKVTETISGENEKPLVCRVQLHNDVAADLYAQYREQKRPRVAIADRQTAESKEALDIWARQQFNVHTPRPKAMVAHVAAVATHPAKGKKDSRANELTDNRQDKLEWLKKRNPESMLLVCKRSKDTIKYYAFIRTESVDVPKVLEHELRDAGKQLTMRPKRLFSMEIDEEMKGELLLEQPALEVMEVEGGAAFNNRPARYFNDRDKETLAEQEHDPVKTAITHLAGREVRFVDLQHDIQLVDKAMHRLQANQTEAFMHTLQELARHADDYTTIVKGGEPEEGQAGIEGVVDTISHLPSMQDALKGSHGRAAEAAKSGAKALQHYQSLLTQLREYRTWISQHTQDGQARQLIVLNPNGTTLERLQDPEVKALMTRPPELHDDIVHGRSALVLYPDPEKNMIAQLEQEQGGNVLRAFSKASPVMDIPDFMAKLRNHLAEEKASQQVSRKGPGTTIPDTAENCLKRSSMWLTNLKPVYVQEEPQHPQDAHAPGEKKIGTRPVLVFKIERAKLPQFDKLFSELQPYLEKGKRFGDTEVMPVKLDDEAQRYLTMSEEREAITEQKRLLQSMIGDLAKADREWAKYDHLSKEIDSEKLQEWGLSGNYEKDTELHGPGGLKAHIEGIVERLRVQSVELTDALDEMDENNRDLYKTIAEYRLQLEMHGGVPQVTVQEHPEYLYLADGTPLEDTQSLGDVIRQQGHAYVKLYMNKSLEQACQSDMRSQIGRRFRNTSINTIPGIRSDEMEACADSLFANDKGR